MLLNLGSDLMEKGIWRMMIQPYLDAMGTQSSYVFWVIMIFLTVGLVYYETKDVYYPFILIVIIGAVFPTAVGSFGLLLGWTMIILGVSGLIIRIVIGRLNKG